MTLALQTSTAGFLQAMALVPQAKEYLTRALAINQTFDQGGSHRVLGRLHFKLPAVLGGDKQAAERHLRRAMELGPRYLLSHLYLAMLLLDQGRDQEAGPLLRQVINVLLDADLLAEHLLWRRQASDLLRGLESP